MTPSQLTDFDVPAPGYLGAFRRRRTLAIGAAAISLLTITINDLPASAAAVQKEAIAAISQRVVVSASSPEPVATREDYVITEYTPVQWPVAPDTEVASGFGWRVAPCSWGCSSDHQGVDFDPGEGSDIVAIADGVVVESSSDGGLGQHVVIEHDIDGRIVQSVYGHMILGSETVGVGDTVTRGQVLGLVGSTGASTGPHLHFEIRPGGGEAVEPLAWLAANVTEEWPG
ncbi:MAG: M23 family metallopeptidase [Schumannella sp.]